MSEMINASVTAVNEAGRVFYEYAAGMFLQTAVLVAVLLCVDRLLRKRVRATVRYWIWMLVFVKLLLPPSLSVPTGIGYWLDRGDTPAVSTAAPEVVGAARSPVPAKAEPLAAMPVIQPAESVPTVSEPSDSVTADLESLTWQGGVFLFWIAGVLVLAGLVVQRWRFVRGLISRSEPASDEWADVLDECRRRMNVRGVVSLRSLPDACSPAVCGLLRPTILAPRALLDRLPPEGLQAVLIHELAHVKRGDLWINSLQTILQAAYFYNPLVWLASAIVRRVREQAVDEMAIVALGAEARSYGNTLIDIAEMTFLRPSPALRLIGVAESRKSLEGRIRHMMTRPIPKSAKVGVIGVLFVAAVGVLLLPMARAQNRTDPGSPNGDYKILLLDNRDPKSRDKDAYDDRLYLMDSKGRIEGAVTGFNIDETFGGSHVLAVDEKRRTLWVVENVGSRLWHFDLAEGKLLHQVPLPRVRAAAVDAATGNVWTVSGDQVGDERPLRVVSPAGQLAATYPIGGYDIAYSDRDDCFWVVGKRVTKIGKDGKVLFQLADEVSWLAPCVSVDQTTGAAWVVVRDNPSVAGSKPELLAVDKNGRLQQRIDLGDLIPFSVAVDSDNGIVWVGCRGTTLRYTTQGEKLKSARFADGFSIVPGASRNSVVAASNFNLAWATVADTGRVDMGFPPIDVQRDLLSSSQKWVAKVSWAGAKLQSSPELARLTLDKDAHLKLADHPESAKRLTALGQAVLMYANDYGDKLPDAVEYLRSYVDEADVRWFLDNVEYLGKGRNVADRPDLVVAYDKSVLRKGEGTLVLYLDSRVAFEGPHKLDTLGIVMPPAATGPDDQEQVARAKSAQRLTALGQAALVFATQHQNWLPDRIEDLPDDPELDKAWLRQNVVYLGAGMKTHNEPDSPVAYDKTLLPNGGGANVLYLDTRVVFEGPDLFGTLGSRREEVERHIVPNYLRELAIAANRYAGDHGGSFSRDMSALKTYMGDEDRFAVVAAKAEYLAGGAKADQIGPKADSTPLAYWKTGPATVGSTAVVFFDTHVQFVLNERLAEFGITAPGSAATGPEDREQAAREKSAETLRSLIRAALIWSNEHDDRLPDSVANLEDELDPADKEWLSKNAAYLGKGLSAADAADRVVAYDKTLLTKGNGTNVLYLDSHVAFEKPGKLETLGITASGFATVQESRETRTFRSYEVNRRVVDFPAGENFSTPEAAYATINRMDRGDPSAWRRVSVARSANRFAADSEHVKIVDPEWTKVLANARIRGVLVWNMTKAAVIAELSLGSSSKKIVEPFDVRYLELEKGRWLNMGNDRFASIEAAETKFRNWIQRETEQAAAMRDPLAHAGEIQAAAVQLFDRLRAADYAQILSYYHDGKWDDDGWKKFPTLGLYTVATDYPSFALWCATHFKDNPIVSVHLGDVFISDALVADKTGRPTVPYKVTLEDGSVLAGNLPFYLSQGKWIGLEGIDWHLWANGTK